MNYLSTNELLILASICLGLGTVLVLRWTLANRLLAKKTEGHVTEEATREAFAEARRELEKIAREGTLSPLSQTFELLYLMQTYVLRRPHDFEQIASDWANRLETLDEDRTLAESLETRLSKESPEWPAGVREVISQTADAIELLINNHHKNKDVRLNLDVELMNDAVRTQFVNAIDYLESIIEALRKLAAPPARQQLSW
ncbi:MAG: hypothetical protein AAFX06_22450 [Planctomycetota bacterium]